MRLDKYLKVSRLIKRRTVANEVADAGRIFINGKIAKASQEQVRNEASDTWEGLLSKIQVSGGTEEQKETFYSALYKAFLW